MPQCLNIISGVATAVEALAQHEAEYGPAPAGMVYDYMIWPDPGHLPGYFFEIKCREYHMKTFRMVVNYEMGSPPTNSAVTTHDWMWLPNEDPPSNAYEAVEEKYDAFFTSALGLFASGAKVVGYRWSPWKDDYSKTDPSIRFASRDMAIVFGGASSGEAITAVPHQIAMAVTEETDVRRRWGRFYLPFVRKGAIVADTSNRFSSAVCNAVGAAAVQLLETIEDEWQHVTVGEPSPKTLPTRFVRVDDVPDVIRSRRIETSAHRYRSAVS